MVDACTAVNKALLEPLVKGYLAEWNQMPSSVRDVLPACLVEAGDRLCSAGFAKLLR